MKRSIEVLDDKTSISFTAGGKLLHASHDLEKHLVGMIENDEGILEVVSLKELFEFIGVDQTEPVDESK